MDALERFLKARFPGAMPPAPIVIAAANEWVASMRAAFSPIKVELDPKTKEFNVTIPDTWFWLTR